MGKKDYIREYILSDDRMREYKKQIAECGGSTEELYWFITTHCKLMRIKLAEYEEGFYTARYIADIFYRLIERELIIYADELYEQLMRFIRQGLKPYPTYIDRID